MNEQRPHDPFDAMARLLADWLRGARLREVVHALHLIRAELSRRGVTVLYSIRQADLPAQDDPCPIAERRAGV